MNISSEEQGVCRFPRMDALAPDAPHREHEMVNLLIDNGYEYLAGDYMEIFFK